MLLWSCICASVHLFACLLMHSFVHLFVPFFSHPSICFFAFQIEIQLPPLYFSWLWTGSACLNVFFSTQTNMQRLDFSFFVFLLFFFAYLIFLLMHLHFTKYKISNLPYPLNLIVRSRRGSPCEPNLRSYSGKEALSPGKSLDSRQA